MRFEIAYDEPDRPAEAYEQHDDAPDRWQFLRGNKHVEDVTTEVMLGRFALTAAKARQATGTDGT